MSEFSKTCEIERREFKIEKDPNMNKINKYDLHRLN